MAQAIVVAPDYRGSTGYEGFKFIDYGGLEVEDAFAATFMIENEPLVDPDRVGILGWSHGGLITLMTSSIIPMPTKGYAVSVSDLVARIRYKGPLPEPVSAHTILGRRLSRTRGVYQEVAGLAG